MTIHQCEFETTVEIIQHESDNFQLFDQVKRPIEVFVTHVVSEVNFEAGLEFYHTSIGHPSAIFEVNEYPQTLFALYPDGHVIGVQDVVDFSMKEEAIDKLFNKFPVYKGFVK